MSKPMELYLHFLVCLHGLHTDDLSCYARRFNVTFRVTVVKLEHGQLAYVGGMAYRPVDIICLSPSHFPAL
jgi:hypothetical protein